jgi:hypothetical protein
MWKATEIILSSSTYVRTKDSEKNDLKEQVKQSDQIVYFLNISIECYSYMNLFRFHLFGNIIRSTIISSS